MKIDLYSRIVLTVIALSLVWLCIKPFAIRTANASRKETININIERVAGHFIRAVPVKLVK